MLKTASPMCIIWCKVGFIQQHLNMFTWKMKMWNLQQSYEKNRAIRSYSRCSLAVLVSKVAYEVNWIASAAYLRPRPREYLLSGADGWQSHTVCLCWKTCSFPPQKHKLTFFLFLIYPKQISFISVGKSQRSFSVDETLSFVLSHYVLFTNISTYILIIAFWH